MICKMEEIKEGAIKKVAAREKVTRKVNLKKDLGDDVYYLRCCYMRAHSVHPLGETIIKKPSFEDAVYFALNANDSFCNFRLWKATEMTVEETILDDDVFKWNREGALRNEVKDFLYKCEQLGHYDEDQNAIAFLNKYPDSGYSIEKVKEAMDEVISDPASGLFKGV